MQEKAFTVCNIDEEGRFGGPARRIVLVAAGLAERGIRTLILIPILDSKEFESEILRRGLWHEKLNYSRLTLEPSQLFRYIIRFPLDLAATVYSLRKNKVDLVHVNGSYQFRSAIAAHLAGKKLVWHVNDTKMHWLVKGVFKFLAPRISDAFIFSAVASREYYFPKGFGAIGYATIAPPVQTEKFSPKSFTSVADGDPAKPLRIITVTGINPDKGVDCFIEAASIIYSKAKNVRFVVAAAIHKSHQSYFESLKRLIHDKRLPDGLIEFIGFVGDIPQFLSSGDIFLYTSNTEAGPAAVWEAMAAGLPVVTTNVGAIPEYFVHGGDALIAPPRDSRRLADLTLGLVSDPSQRASLGRAARKKVEDYLSVDAAAKKHADLYRETLTHA